MDEKRESRKYKCILCGYTYDPKLGAERVGIPPGIDFEDLPDDWVCPVCSVSKENFKLLP